MRSTVTKLIIFCSMISMIFAISTNSSRAAGALAIWLTDDVSRDGVELYSAVKYDTINQAKAKALAGCKAKTSKWSGNASCKIVATFKNKCAAEALDPKEGTPGFGYAIAGDSETAKREAIANCRKTAGNGREDACVVGDRGLWCDGSAN
jgi:hypothetical protein